MSRPLVILNSKKKDRKWNRINIRKNESEKSEQENKTREREKI